MTVQIIEIGLRGQFVRISHWNRSEAFAAVMRHYAQRGMKVRGENGRIIARPLSGRAEA